MTYLLIYLFVAAYYCLYTLMPFRAFLPPERIIIHAVAALCWPALLVAALVQALMKK